GIRRRAPATRTHRRGNALSVAFLREARRCRQSRYACACRRNGYSKNDHSDRAPRSHRHATTFVLAKKSGLRLPLIATAARISDQRAEGGRTYLKIGYAARLLCRFLARPSLYVCVLSRDSLRAFAYSACSPHFEIGSSRFLIGLTSRVAQTRGVDPHHSSRQMDLAQEREQSADQRNHRADEQQAGKPA